MSDHDKFCPYNHEPPDRLCATCILLEAARADEREQIQQGILQLPNDITAWDEKDKLLITYTRWQAYSRCLAVARRGGNG